MRTWLRNALTGSHRELRLSAGCQHLDGTMKVTVYTSFWCPDCREAKRFLQQNKISFQEIDIENTPGAADEVVKQTGKRAIPQFVIDGEWVQPYRPGKGFLYEEMAERLGVKDA